MGKSLVIVESPAKAKTINKYLGSDFVVKSSVGHIRDLPTSGSGSSSVDEVLAAYWRAGSQNVALRRQVESDRNRIIEARAIAQENARLKRLF